MILTLSWLKNHLNTKASINEIIEKLTNIGLEVEGIKEGSGNLSEFKIAKILKPKSFISLRAKLGVGKTTLAIFIINNLSKKKIRVLSPTFSLVNIYDLKNI